MISILKTMCTEGELFGRSLGVINTCHWPKPMKGPTQEKGVPLADLIQTEEDYCETTWCGHTHIGEFDKGFTLTDSFPLLISRKENKCPRAKQCWGFCAWFSQEKTVQIQICVLPAANVYSTILWALMWKNMIYERKCWEPDSGPFYAVKK